MERNCCTTETTIYGNQYAQVRQKTIITQCFLLPADAQTIIKFQQIHQHLQLYINKQPIRRGVLK